MNARQRLRHAALLCVLGAAVATVPTTAAANETRPKRAIGTIPTPVGFTRQAAAAGNYTAYLRGMALKPAGTRVRLFNGAIKPNQAAHHAVVALSTGTRDLQQCADAIIRIRSEYHWSRKRADAISFKFTNGTPVPWKKWRAGWRTRVRGNKVSWVKSRQASSSRATFDGYLKTLMMYAGTASLSRELPRRKRAMDLRPGDALVQGGYPGHAVMVLDKAVSARGEAIVLLGQSFIPAQDFHVLKNPRERALSPWYRVSDLTQSRGLKTPEWRAFRLRDVRHFDRH